MLTIEITVDDDESLIRRAVNCPRYDWAMTQTTPTSQYITLPHNQIPVCSLYDVGSSTFDVIFKWQTLSL